MAVAERSNIVLEYVTSSLLATNPVPMTHLSHCIFEQKKARVRTIIATNTPCVLEIIIFFISFTTANLLYSRWPSSHFGRRLKTKISDDCYLRNNFVVSTTPCAEITIAIIVVADGVPWRQLVLCIGELFAFCLRESGTGSIFGRTIDRLIWSLYLNGWMSLRRCVFSNRNDDGFFFVNLRHFSLVNHAH